MSIWLSFSFFPFLSLFPGLQYAPVDSQALDRQVIVLQYRLQLAQDRRPFIEIGREDVLAFLKGVAVKSFPVQHSGFPWAIPRMSRIASITPGASVRHAVVKADEGEFSDNVSALEDIVSAKDMPDSFCMTLTDGSFFYLTARARRAFQLLSQPTNFCVLQMDRKSVQHLFWLLRPGMGVIY